MPLQLSCGGTSSRVRSASAFAPGRIELLGNHTDYHEGIVLSAAIDRGVTARMQTRDDDEIHLRSDAFETKAVARVNEIVPFARGHWANYPLGVAREFVREGFAIGGFDAQFSSTLSLGAGLSSSAALEVGTGTALAKLFGHTIEPMRLAKMCRRAENEFAGVSSGLLDQVSSVFGECGRVVFLDCRSETVRLLPFPDEYVLLVVHSGVVHRLAGGEYNERRAESFRAAELLGVRVLRDATKAKLENARDRLPDVFYRRAAHIIGENERVLAAAAALERGDVPALGRLMLASHASSRVNFENSTPELDLLVRDAAKHPGVLGARLTGGGFGGATVSLVRREAAAGADRKSVV